MPLHKPDRPPIHRLTRLRHARLGRLLLPRLSLLGSACASLLSACSGVNVLNAVIPSGGYTMRANIAYGTDVDQHLDVYVPKTPWTGRGARPTVLFVHGGSWESGDKGMYKFVAEAITSRGWVAVVPDYRKYPRVRWPVFMDDCAEAFQWAGVHAAEWGGDRQRVIAMGHSAGAHMAALLTLDGRWLARFADPVRPVALVGLSGPYDFLPITGPDIQAIFAPAQDLAETQPIHFAHAGAPPSLLLHGAVDETVWPKNTRNLAARLRAAGATVEEHVYPGMDHIRMVVALARPFRFRYPVLDDIARFVEATALPRAAAGAEHNLAADGLVTAAGH